MEERVQLHLIQDSVRLAFIEHELRARRLMLLPEIYLWEADVRRWKAELEEWEETHKVLYSMGHGGAKDESVFRFPPKRPSVMPAEFGEEKPKGEQEILDMISRARANPKGGGWTPIPKQIIGVPVSKKLAGQNKKKVDMQPCFLALRRKVDYGAGCDEEHPYGYFGEEDQQKLFDNEGEDELPGGFPNDLAIRQDK